jgi:carboxymethylenebutenolidase
MAPQTTIDEKTGISRRSLLAGAAGLPLAAILASPALAELSAATATEVTITTKSGGHSVSASLFTPDATPAGAVILIHEWWGLNDQIKSVGAELAKLGYLALAIDLYGGEVATSADEAMQLIGSVNDEVGVDTVQSWANWLREHSAGSGKVAVMGWCFGGGWSLETAIEAGVDASIIYYGQVTAPAERLASITGPVLGHFATQDQFINKPMVDGFEANMAAAGKDLTVYRYDADHAFANPTSARYDDEDAALSWARTTEFLASNLASNLANNPAGR